MANEYVDFDIFKEETLGLRAASDYADSDIAAALEAASRGLDAACNRWFYRSSESNDDVRLYTPDRWRTLIIDDTIAVTSVLVDQDGNGTFEQEWDEGTDFVLDPANAALAGRPYERLIVRKRGRYDLPIGLEHSVQVTGQFGWIATPPAIVQATTILASKLLKRAREAPFGVLIAGLEVSAVARIARTDPDVSWLLEGLIREEIV